MRCGSIHDAISVLDDAIELCVFILLITTRMKKHRCFSPEEIARVLGLKKKWDASAMMQSYVNTY